MKECTNEWVNELMSLLYFWDVVVPIELNLELFLKVFLLAYNCARYELETVLADFCFNWNLKT
jgi:hypothetical protein